MHLMELLLQVVLFGVLIYGVRRGAFSNEAGMGTESLVHGVAKVSNPVKQGLVNDRTNF